ncbi:serine hydrolase domain-containing protein [Flavobacterium kingsejongi]|uniref:Serine hydrolase n=1 Tax=Flavobacterium kingsejongi TaxID=1678728 RepID=A0A2S1LKT1_9FLAO|nr:serine hydrolase domain-containing protein [Flavobacterium kingsejongi]AWG24383.1 serine hydrolase [Flavobacterium kingsejongi]
MKTATVLLLSLSFFIHSGLQAQQKQTTSNRQADAFIVGKMKSLKIPGLAFAVIKDGKQVYSATYGMGNLEWQTKVTPQTNFQIASCTKLLTSTLVLKTLYNGKLNLEDPVSKYVDSIPFYWKELKIKHLLSHSSGIRNFEGDTYASETTVLKAIKEAAPEYAPGTDQHYAQFDFMLMGYILEKIYHKPFVQILKDEVTTPLGMKNGGYDMELKVGTFMRTDLIPQKVTTYYDLEGKTQAYKFLYPQFTYTAGGYFASLDNMSQWAIGLDQGTLFPKDFGNQYIYERDSIGSRISEFSKVGWALENENGILYGGHSGGPGLGDILRFPEEGYTFIVLSNDGELLPDFARAIAPLYIKALSPKTEIRKFER